MTRHLLTLALTLGLAACGAPQPGQEAFSAADRALNAYKEHEAFGNGPVAQSLAQRFAKTMGTMRQVAFTESRGGPSISKGHFLTHCQITDQDVVFLVHVPELRKFSEDAQGTLLDLAWTVGRGMASELSGPPRRLTIGFRGAVFYGGIASGPASSRKPDVKSTSGAVDLSPVYAAFTRHYPADVTVTTPDAPTTSGVSSADQAPTMAAR